MLDIPIGERIDFGKKILVAVKDEIFVGECQRCELWGLSECDEYACHRVFRSDQTDVHFEEVAE